jgi:hypothetical protein
VNKFRLTLLGLTMAAGLVIPATAAQASPATPSVQPAGSTFEGCPFQDVCIYPNASWNGGHPSATYFAYGTYNLSNQFGLKRFFNNQSGHAGAALCTGFNGGGTCVWQPVFTFSDDNFTPINSIIVSPTGG